MFLAEAGGQQITPEQIGFLIQVLAWIGVPSAAAVGLWRVIKFVFRVKAALETIEAIDVPRVRDALQKIEMIAVIVMGDGNGEYGWKEGRRRLEAVRKKLDEFHEMAQGEHGFYSIFAAIDAKLNGWAQWRHDVIDKELNRMVLQIGRLEDKHEDLQKEMRTGGGHAK